MGKKESQCLPLLFTSHGEGEGDSSKQSFYNLLENRYKTTSIPILTKKSILNSSYGWLVLLDPDEGDCCMWNPTLNQTIEIPEFENPHFYQRCLLSKSPTHPDCFIVFSFVCCRWQLIYRIGDNTVVKFHSEEEGYRIIAMLSFQGMIYGIIERLGMFECDFVTIHIAGDKLETMSLFFDGTAELSSEVFSPFNLSYLIESPRDNELLLVTKVLSSYYLENCVHFMVFRVDVSTMQFEEVRNLDGLTIFISYYGNGFCRSSESFSGAIKPNCIYYTNSNGNVVYIYDLDDRGTITMLPYPDVDINPNTSESIWVDLPDIFNSLGLV